VTLRFAARFVILLQQFRPLPAEIQGKIEMGFDPNASRGMLFGQFM
jgi:hypothetical protein